ncbi:MAG: phage holin family protein [Salinibacterium sp.]|nr:phage holin family protein [Salinibacterium sp.]
MTGVNGPAPKRSLFKLISDIPGLLADLVRGEIEALKQELLGKLKLAGVGIGFLVVAATFAFFAVLVLIASAVLGLATVLPGWAAALIIGGGVLVLAVISALIGIASLKKGVPPAPTETIKSIKKDVRVIKGTGMRATS